MTTAKVNAKAGKKSKPTPAQLRANRENARRSTGPRTEEGKAVARMNGVTHGMCARHPVVLPGETLAAFEAEYYRWYSSLAPAGAEGEFWLGQALLHKRALDRGQRHEHEALARAAADADRAWDADREREVQELVGRLEAEPAAAAEGLRGSAAGVQWLLGRWWRLREDLDEAGCWNRPQKDQALRLLGVRPGDVLFDPIARAVTLDHYHCAHARPEDLKGLERLLAGDAGREHAGHMRELMAGWLEDWPAEYDEAAAARLAELCDAETASLRARAEELRPSEEALRLGAAEAAMLADGKAVATRLRYATTNTRLMERALDHVARCGEAAARRDREWHAANRAGARPQPPVAAAPVFEPEPAFEPAPAFEPPVFEPAPPVVAPPAVAPPAAPAAQSGPNPAREFAASDSRVESCASGHGAESSPRWRPTAPSASPSRPPATLPGAAAPPPGSWPRRS